MKWNIKNVSSADFTKDVGLRNYMNKIYLSMFFGLGVTALTVLYSFLNPTLILAITSSNVIFIGLGILLMLSGFIVPSVIQSASVGVGRLAFYLASILFGLFMTPLIMYAAALPDGMADVLRAFLITSIMFGSTSLYGYLTKKDLSVYGRALFMVSIGFLVAIVINMFMQSSIMSTFISFGIVLYVAFVTAYETQAIRNIYYSLPEGEQKEKAITFGAFTLYSNFIIMFIHVLSLLLRSRE